MARLFNRKEDDKIFDEKEKADVMPTEKIEVDDKNTIVEREINLSLVNEKVNVLLNLCQEILQALKKG